MTPTKQFKNIIVLSDIHIKMMADTTNDAWELNRLLELAGEVNKVASPDTLIVLNGDTLDRQTPKLEDISALYKFIEELNKSGATIYLLSGNHEMRRRSLNETIYDYIPQVGYKYIKEYVALDFGEDIKVHLVGYPLLHLVEYLDTKSAPRNLLITHYRSGVAYASDELDNNKLSKKFTQVIAGDIHYHYKPFDNIEYTSQPYSNKYSKPDVEYGFIEVDTNLSLTYHTLDLPNKITLTVSGEELADTVKALDDKHRYKLIVKGNKLPEYLKLLEPFSNVTAKFLGDKLELDNSKESLEEKVATQKERVDIYNALYDTLMEETSVDKELLGQILQELKET